MTFYFKYLLCVALGSFVGNCDGARILGFFSFPSKSHFGLSKAIMEGLAKKGYNVTVVGFFPNDNPPPGYKDISLEGLMPVYINSYDIDNPPGKSLNVVAKAFLQLKLLAKYANTECHALLPSQQIQELLKSKGEYDLAIASLFQNECFLSIFHQLEIPYIGISSSTILPQQNRRYGNPMDPTVVNNVFIGATTRMNLYERIINSIVNFIYVSLADVMYNWPADRLIKQYIGDVPPVKTLAHNTSLILINTHFSLHQPRPSVPGVIEIGGAHLQPLKPLPKDLEKFVSSAKDGVVIFSLGTFLDPATMPQYKKDAFINAFKSIPQKIIWRYKGDIANLPPNVYLMNWIPQNDLLAHPNVKGFIGHGGINGMWETIAAGKPFISIPIFSDQFTNIRLAAEAGVAVELPYDEISDAKVKESLKTILSDKYQANAKKLSEQFKDRPLSPLDTAIYWVEYILKYGPNSVRSSAVHLTDIEYYQIDLFLIFTVIIFALLYSVKLVLTKIACKLYSLIFKSQPEKMKKQ